MCLVRKHPAATPTLLLATTLASLAFYLFVAADHAAAALYLPHARIWQFTGGALLAYWHTRRPTPVNKLAMPLSVFGIVAVYFALYVLRAGQPFAGAWSLLPILGTMALLISEESWFNRRVLSLGPLVCIGELSYQLYLWHWMLLGYCHILEDTQPVFEVRNPALILAFALAWLTYRYIERPIRSGRLRTCSTHYLILTIVSIFAAGACIEASDGFSKQTAV